MMKLFEVKFYHLAEEALFVAVRARSISDDSDVEMDLITPLRSSIYLSQAFGLISFKIKDINGELSFSESKWLLRIGKISFGFFSFFHVLLVVFSVSEIIEAQEFLYVKIVRLIHVMAFTGSMAVMFLTVTTKGSVLCTGLNQVNELYVSFVSRIANRERVKGNLTLFLGTIVNYLATVFPLLLMALYIQRTKSSKVISYAYYAVSMWLENIFIYQFTTIATVVGEAYGFVTQIPVHSATTSEQLLCDLRKSRNNDEIVKDFIDDLVQVYKYALFFWICWSFTMILQFVLKVNLRLRVVVWCFFICYRVIMIIYACSIIRKETEKTAENLQQLLIGTDDPLVREEIEIYSLQLLHRRPEFSACGFFSLDFSLFHSMVASVTTYIIVLMQLQIPADSNYTKLGYNQTGLS